VLDRDGQLLEAAVTDAFGKVVRPLQISKHE
jgi:hypothetical protein